MFPEEKEKSPFCLINRASSGKSPWRRHHITKLTIIVIILTDKKKEKHTTCKSFKKDIELGKCRVFWEKVLFQNSWNLDGKERKGRKRQVGSKNWGHGRL